MCWGLTIIICHINTLTAYSIELIEKKNFFSWWLCRRYSKIYYDISALFFFLKDNRTLECQEVTSFISLWSLGPPTGGWMPEESGGLARLRRACVCTKFEVALIGTLLCGCNLGFLYFRFIATRCFLDTYTFPFVVRVLTDGATMSVAGLKKQLYKASQVKASLCH